MFEDYKVQPPIIKTELWATRVLNDEVTVLCQTLYDISLQKDSLAPITRTHVIK